MIFVVIIAIWIGVFYYGWDAAEQYTFLIQILIDGLLVAFGVLGWRVGLKSIAIKLGDFWSKKYKEDICVNINEIQSQRTSASERLDQLKHQNSDIGI